MWSLRKGGAMSKKRKKKSIVAPRENRDLFWYMEHFDEYCDNPKCNSKLVVHIHRPKSKTKKEAVYAHCENKGVCPRAMLEICFIEKFI